MDAVKKIKKDLAALKRLDRFKLAELAAKCRIDLRTLKVYLGGNIASLNTADLIIETAKTL